MDFLFLKYTDLKYTVLIEMTLKKYSQHNNLDEVKTHNSI